jgi:DnaJ-class molecular chaperone
MRDPYEVLGVDRKASAGDIKSAFRKLAKKLHPDANKNDPKAAGRFAELNAAYEILGEDDKRKAFDRGEIDAEGKPRFRGFEGFGGGAGGRPGGGFGGGAGANVSAALTVALRDAARGATQRLRLPNGKDVEVKIPAGIANGQQIRLRGQGGAGPNGPGDLLITVSLAPDAIFTLDGADIRLDLPVTLYEAALGAKVRVPTLERPVELTIPPGTSGGRTFRLKGKGYPAKEGPGDLLATIRIMLPQQSDADFEALMKKWRTEKPYDPRKDMEG